MLWVPAATLIIHQTNLPNTTSLPMLAWIVSCEGGVWGVLSGAADRETGINDDTRLGRPSTLAVCGGLCHTQCLWDSPQHTACDRRICVRHIPMWDFVLWHTPCAVWHTVCNRTSHIHDGYLFQHGQEPVGRPLMGHAQWSLMNWPWYDSQATDPYSWQVWGGWGRGRTINWAGMSCIVSAGRCSCLIPTLWWLAWRWFIKPDGQKIKTFTANVWRHYVSRSAKFMPLFWLTISAVRFYVIIVKTIIDIRIFWFL